MTQEIKKKRGRPRRKPAKEVLDAQLKLSRANIYERAFERLRGLIIRGELAPDTVLVEAELCALLGISRTPLREAIKLLAAQGLVELRQNRSARVAPMKSEDIRDLFETMGGIERLAAELAALRISTDELARLHDMQDKMERHYAAGELNDYFSLNQAIHRAIVAGAGNSTLRQTHEWLLSRAERARYIALGSPRRWDESVAEHRGILAALEARDARAAGAQLERHVLNTGREVIKALKAQNESAARKAAE